MGSMTAPRERLRVGGDEMTVMAASAESGGALLAYEVEMAAGGGPPALHRHAAAELVRVMAGELAVYRDDERVVAGVGDIVVIEGNREHTIRNESEAPARAFMVLSPGAEIEAFARAAAAARPEDVPAVAAAHGVEMTRPVP